MQAILPDTEYSQDGLYGTMAMGESELEQTVPGGVRRGGCAGGKIQLAQDAGYVAVYGMLAHHQPFGDLLVGESFGEQAQHLAFAWGDLP